MDKDPAIIFIGEVGGSHSFKAHQGSINRDSMKYQNHDHASHPQQNVLKEC